MFMLFMYLFNDYLLIIVSVAQVLSVLINVHFLLLLSVISIPTFAPISVYNVPNYRI
jgi:hypothetical protein